MCGKNSASHESSPRSPNAFPKWRFRLSMNRAPSAHPSPPVGERVAEGWVRGFPVHGPKLTSNLCRCSLLMNLILAGPATLLTLITATAAEPQAGENPADHLPAHITRMTW